MYVKYIILYLNVKERLYRVCKSGQTTSNGSITAPTGGYPALPETEITRNLLKRNL